MAPISEKDDCTNPPSKLLASVRPFFDVYVLFYQLPIVRNDFKRAGVYNAFKIIVLSSWQRTSEGGEKKTDRQAIIMSKILEGMKLDNTIIFLESLSSLRYVMTKETPEQDDSEALWNCNHLYASGKVVLFENQDTALCQAYHLPEVLEFMNALAHGIVFQLNVTTLTPHARGMLYRDFVYHVLTTTDLMPLGLYRSVKKTVWVHPTELICQFERQT